MFKTQESQQIPCFFPHNLITRLLFKGHSKKWDTFDWCGKGIVGKDLAWCFLHSNVEIIVNAVISLWYSTLETCLQDVCSSPSSAEENGDQFYSPPQKHWDSWGGLWHCHDPCAWTSQRCGQLLPALAGVGCALLSPASRGSSQTLRPCPGVWNPAHLPPADCAQAWGPVFWEEVHAPGKGRKCWESRGATLFIWESPSGQNEVVIGKQKYKKWTFPAVVSMTPLKISVCVLHLIYLSWGSGKNIILKLMALWLVYTCTQNDLPM